MKGNYETLRKSPMFHMSLHAKELFHSNFLVWLWEDPELRGVFKAVMKSLGIDEKVVDSWDDDLEVLREKYNLDIILKARDKEIESAKGKKKIQSGEWFAVVENKVKSIPTSEQLQSYSKKIEEECKSDASKVDKILLGLVDYKESLADGWRAANYSQVVDALKDSLDSVTDPYKKSIISDYIDVLNALTGIISQQEKYLDPKSKFIVEPDAELDYLRISDLVDKWRVSRIANMISSKYGEVCRWGYTNKTPLIENPNDGDKEEVSMGVQIQGNQYRHYFFANVEEDRVAEESKGFLSPTRESFRKYMLEKYGDIFESKKISGEDKKSFLSYGKEKKPFWYQYVIIKDGVTIEQIMECFVKDMKDARNKLAKSHNG